MDPYIERTTQLTAVDVLEPQIIDLINPYIDWTTQLTAVDVLELQPIDLHR